VTASAGGGGIFSIGAGFTTKDQDCEKRAYAQSLAALGKDKAAIAILFQSENVAAAMAAVGEVCPGARQVGLVTTSAPVTHAVGPQPPQAIRTDAPYSSGTGIQSRPLFGG